MFDFSFLDMNLFNLMWFLRLRQKWMLLYYSKNNNVEKCELKEKLFFLYYIGLMLYDREKILFFIVYNLIFYIKIIFSFEILRY